MWREQPYDLKSDIWSLGCVLYEMIALKPPFRAQSMKDLYKKVLRGHFPKIPGAYSTELARTVTRMIQVQPKSRPTSEELLESHTVLEKFAQHFPEEYKEAQADLLNTIRVPMNLHYLTERLPKPDYERVVGAASNTGGTFRREPTDLVGNPPSSGGLKLPRKKKKPTRIAPLPAPRSLPPHRSVQGHHQPTASGNHRRDDSKDEQDTIEPEPTKPIEEAYPAARYRLKKRKPSVARLRQSAANS